MKIVNHHGEEIYTSFKLGFVSVYLGEVVQWIEAISISSEGLGSNPLQALLSLLKEVKTSPDCKMLKLLTLDNSFPSVRHSRYDSW